MPEWLELIFRGRVGKSSLNSDIVVVLDRDQY